MPLLRDIPEQELSDLLDEARRLWETGQCCPTRCGVTRRWGAAPDREPPCGGSSTGIKVASFAVHNGEEPPVSGWNGAGNIFFSGCNMHCLFCQNWPISHDNNGRLHTAEEFAVEVKKLLAKKVHNLNLTTADHYLYPVFKALAGMRGEIAVPISYNCSGYFAEEALAVVLRFCDIFLYDVKYLDPALAARYSRAPGYVDAMTRGLEILRAARIPWGEDDLGILQRGLIIRHLVIPGAVENSLKALDLLAAYRDRGMIFKLSLMSQYFPAYRATEHPDISRRITRDEYDPIVARMEELDLDGWTQDLDAHGGA
ncbi:MAG TPA: radical SAM protein [bacterium]|nr:radical SAM protein [bacterium]